MDSVGAVLISVGRLFQSLGAAMANARSPLDLSLVLGTTNQNQNQKELYCQVCLHTQGICLGVRSFQYRKYKHSADNI